MKMHRTTLLAVLAPVAAAYNADANNVHLQFASSPSGSVSPEAVEEARPEEHLQLLEEHLVTVDLPNLDTAEAILGQFEEWVGRHSKSYESMEERARRMLVWADNHVMIETHNNKPEQSSFTLGHNQFSDQTHDEFQRLMGLGPYSPELQHSDTKVWNFMEDEEAASDEHEGGLRGAPPAAVATERRLSSSFTPDDNGGIDWHLKGLMGYVRNQGLCGACWAFSAIGSIESSMAIDKFNDMTPDEQRALSESKMSAVSGETLVDNDLGLVVPLSEQNLIDCDTLREKGCEGGLMVTDFDEEEVKNGICAETDYPYLQTQGTCASSMCTPVPGSIVKDHVDLVPRKTNNLVTALKKKPVTAAMVANDPMLQFYSSGIFTSDTCGKVTKEMGTPDCKMLYPGQDVCLPDINHGVLVVGYGTDKTVEGDGPKDYFKVKNSWGNAWGEGGYFRLARSETDPADPKGNWGMCAILTLLSYPEMK